MVCLVFQAAVGRAPAAQPAVRSSGAVSAGGPLLHQRPGTGRLYSTTCRRPTPQVRLIMPSRIIHRPQTPCIIGRELQSDSFLLVQSSESDFPT